MYFSRVMITDCRKTRKSYNCRVGEPISMIKFSFTFQRIPFTLGGTLAQSKNPSHVNRWTFSF